MFGRKRTKAEVQAEILGVQKTRNQRSQVAAEERQWAEAALQGKGGSRDSAAVRSRRSRIASIEESVRRCDERLAELRREKTRD